MNLGPQTWVKTKDVSCPACNGHGKVIGHPKLVDCPVCAGSGTVAVKDGKTSQEPDCYYTAVDANGVSADVETGPEPRGASRDSDSASPEILEDKELGRLYDTGYKDGESSATADFMYQFGEDLGLDIEGPVDATKKILALLDNRYKQGQRDGEQLSAMIFTGDALCPITRFHAEAERLLGRPIWTHEFADQVIMDEIKATKRVEIMKQLTEEPQHGE